MARPPMSIEEGQEAAKAIGAAEGPSNRPVGGPELLARPGKLIDLTRPIFEGMPMWFGHQKTFIVTNQDHEDFKRQWKTNTGFYARNLMISEHCGSHTDAIIEYDASGPSLTETPLNFYWGEAVCLDLSGVEFQDPDPDGNGYATKEDVAAAEGALKAAGEKIRPGDIVFGWFDYGDRHFPSRKFIDEFPGFSFDGAEYLAEKGVINLGTDCPGIDNSLDPEFSAHMVCKKHGLVNTENIANLGELVNLRFLFFGLPLNIEGGTGSPIRAVAYVPDEA